MTDYTRLVLFVATVVLAALASWVLVLGGFYLVVNVLFGWPS
jgi:hypothetical protein